VPKGGLLFRWYLHTFACWTGRRLFNAACKRRNQNDVLEDYLDPEFADLDIVEQNANPDHNAISQADNDKLIKDHGSKFVGWLITTLGNYGQHAKPQQFYVTFISNYFGLSRGGIMTMGNLGLGATKTFFDKTKAIILQRFDERIRYHICLSLYIYHFIFFLCSNL
jgi:hypothetical protein